MFGMNALPDARAAGTTVPQPNDISSGVLLLTATVRPPAGVRQLARTDPAARLGDYQRALGFYLSLLARGALSGIVFGDNSASDLSTLQAMARACGLSSRTEFLSFDDQAYPPSHGRGFGEFRLVDLLMERSALIGQLSAQAVIWKVTGRYVVRNLVQLMASRPPTADLYCHCRNIPQRWVDLYMLAWTKRSYERVLRGISEHLKEDQTGRSAEVMFRDVVDHNCARAAIVRRFTVPPKVEGFRGFDNRPYEDSKSKYLVRHLSARVMPWLWV